MRILLAILSFTLFFACKQTGTGDHADTSSKEPAALEAALMVLHDTSMLKLNEINRLSGELRTIRAEVDVTDMGAEAYPAGLDNVLEDLKLADQGMWDWMKAYSDNKPKQTEEQLAAFYEKEIEKMKAVDAAIDSSIANAKNWLTAHGSAPK